MQTAVEVEGLVKKFGDFDALSKINLSVPKGSILGLVGPNGAGKSTLIRILLGLCLASSGEAKVLGYDVQTESHLIRANAGYVPDKLPFSWETVIELIAGFAYLHGFSRADSRRRAREVLEVFDAYEYREKRFRDLSDGMKKRVILALASVHDPTILFLDEPTANLDVTGVQTLRSLIRRQQAQGNCIVLATHRTRLVQSLCNRLAILFRGRLVFSGSTQEFIVKMQRGDILVPNSSLNDVEIKPELLERFKLTPIGAYTLIPKNCWDDFQKETHLDGPTLKWRPEPASLSYALAKYYALGVSCDSLTRDAKS